MPHLIELLILLGSLPSAHSGGSPPARGAHSNNSANAHKPNSVSFWAENSVDFTTNLASLLRAHENTVQIDNVMLGCGIGFLTNGSMACTDVNPDGACASCKNGTDAIKALGLSPYVWFTGGSLNSSMDAFRTVVAHSESTVQGFVDLCQDLGLSGINLDWELGPATPADRSAFTQLLAKLKSALAPLGCKLSLHSGGGREQLNRVQKQYMPSLDEVTCGALYRGTSIDDWKSTLAETLAVVPAAKLRPGFCCDGCKDAWSATNASVTERFEVLSTLHKDITNVAMWRLMDGCPTQFYWSQLSEYAPL